MIDPQTKIETLKAGGNSLIGVGATVMTLNEWVALATLIYILLQAGLLIPKYLEMFKRKKDA